MDAIQTADPDGGLLLSLFLLFCQFSLIFRVLAPCVVGFIIDDQNILSIGHLSQHLTGVCFITFGSPLIHTPTFFDGLLAVPRQRLPVGDQHFALPQLVHQNAKPFALYFRVGDVYKNVRIVVECEGKVLLSRKKQKAAPGEMETLLLKEEHTAKITGPLTVRLEKEGD